MTFLEFKEGLKVLEQYYLIEELGGFLKMEYDEETKRVLIKGDFPLKFDEQLDENYKIDKNIQNDKVLTCPYITQYKFKSINQFFYFLITFRNYVYKDILPTIDCLDYMLYTYKQNIFNKGYFSISNDEWMNNNSLYLETLNKRPVKLIPILDSFDKSVNPFLDEEFDEEKFKYLYDVDIFDEESLNCGHFSIKNNNIIKSYKRHSKGYFYSQKIIGENNLYIGHYFNTDGEVISIISDEIKIRYNITHQIVEYMDQVVELNEDIIQNIFNLILKTLETENRVNYIKTK